MKTDIWSYLDKFNFCLWLMWWKKTYFCNYRSSTGFRPSALVIIYVHTAWTLAPLTLVSHGLIQVVAGATVLFIRRKGLTFVCYKVWNRIVQLSLIHLKKNQICSTVYLTSSFIQFFRLSNVLFPKKRWSFIKHNITNWNGRHIHCNYNIY